MQFDYDYLCQGLGHLTGLETRVYLSGECISHYSHCDFEPDIAAMVLPEIEATTDNVFYIETEDLLLFGVIKCCATKHIIIIGPTSQIRPKKQSQKSILFQLKQPYVRLAELDNYFNSMIPYPFETFLEILCFVNYALNDEKTNVADLVRQSDKIESYLFPPNETEAEMQNVPHNTHEMEKTMLSYVKNGDVEAMERFFKEPPTGRIGTIAHDALRQKKNTFLCAATLISRAAIDGGVTADIAFALSDRYIQKAELLNNSGDITLLSMEMMMDYTRRVEIIKCAANESKFVRDIRRYIMRSISKKISVENVASTRGVNRTYLCDRFKQETGMTVGAFILKCKMDEAKRLLAVSQLSIAQISDLLAFSSQSYFQNVFKKETGDTPKVYREKAQAGF